MEIDFDEIVRKIQNVDEDVVEYFQKTASQLIKQMGAEKALCLALAEIGGITKKLKSTTFNCSIQDKSKGYLTYLFISEC
jgi:hypothetical protein